MTEKIRQLFSLLFNGIDLRKMVIDVTSAQGRIGMEAPYDRLAETVAFRFLRRQSRVTKYVTVVAASFLVAFLDQKVNPKSFLGQVMEGILWDSGPELAKRMLDDDGKYLKEYLMKNFDKLSESDKEILPIIFALRGKYLRNFIEWFLSVSREEGSGTVRSLGNLLEGVRNFAGRGEARKEKEFTERVFDSVISGMKKWKYGLDAWLQNKLEKEAKR